MTSSAEIAHVLFLDLVGYSRETTAAQSRLVAELNRIVGESPTFVLAKEQGRLLALPTGDGMAILFTGEVAAPAQCALEISSGAGDLQVRMGIHSGPVQRNQDISGRDNVAGEGINMAQRVMDSAEVGRIAISTAYGGWLNELDHWKERIGPPRRIVAKHGVELVVHYLAAPGDLESGAVAPAED